MVKYSVEIIEEAQEYYSADWATIKNTHIRNRCLLGVTYFDALIDFTKGCSIIELAEKYGITYNYMYESLRRAENRVLTFIKMKENENGKEVGADTMSSWQAAE